MADGTTEWALIYDAGTGGAVTANLLVAAPSAGGWGPVLNMPVGNEFAQLQTIDVGESQMLSVSDVGAHAGHLIIVGESGSSLQTAFDGWSDEGPPGLITLGGTPTILSEVSPYCHGHADSPKFPQLFQWNGSQFAPYQGVYPDSMLAPYVAELTRAPSGAGDWPSFDVACLYGDAAYLASKQGDSATANQACGKPRALDPDFTSTSASMFGC
jgi:hypothetical protein